jgi:hypothetical protein
MRAGRVERCELGVADELDVATIIPRCALSGGVTVLFLLASPALRRTDLEPAGKPAEP